MQTLTNNNRIEILELMNKAKGKIQIAVSWMTDEIIIDAISKLASRIKVEILLSKDVLNVFRYPEIIKLQSLGAKVVKNGADFSGERGFMHAKYMIIDEIEVYGGSYNFTANAAYNIENFDKYPPHKLSYYLNLFKENFYSGINYRVGFDNYEEIKRLIFEKFNAEEKFKDNFQRTINLNIKDHFIESNSDRNEVIRAEMRTLKNDISLACPVQRPSSNFPPVSNNTERVTVNSIESKKDNLLSTAKQIINGDKKVTSSGTLASTGDVISKPHRFYGGSIKAVFKKTLKNGFASIILQEKELNEKFPFLKTIVKNDTLFCTGKFIIEGCDPYLVRIEYRPGDFPRVFILNKKIVDANVTHVYREGFLCLFYPGDMKWKRNTSISEYTIPWIFEWIIFYEIYLISGKWEGSYVPHNRLKHKS